MIYKKCKIVINTYFISLSNDIDKQSEKLKTELCASLSNYITLDPNDIEIVLHED